MKNTIFPKFFHLVCFLIVIVPNFTIAQQASIKVEAEDMKIEEYFIEENPLYSGEKGLKLDGANNTGFASYKFDGESGLYTIKIRYVDEKEDDFSRILVYVGDTKIHEWTANLELGHPGLDESNITFHVIRNVALKKDDQIKIEGHASSGPALEHARLDFILLVKQDAEIPEIKIEAEDMALSTYAIEEKPEFSGGKGIAINEQHGVGIAIYVFDGDSAFYNMTVRYVDEKEVGIFAEYTVSVGERIVDAWRANKELGFHSVSDKTLTERVIRFIPLNPGDLIKIEGKATCGDHMEHARLDYIVFTPNPR